MSIVELSSIKKNSNANAEFDFSDKSFDSDSKYALNGKWKLLHDDGTFEYVNFPEELRNSDSSVKTYETTVIVPYSDRYYGIITPEIYSSYRLTVNDNVIYENGYFANADTHSVYSNIHSIHVPDNKITIRLSIHNNCSINESKGRPIYIASFDSSWHYILKMGDTNFILAVLFLGAFIYYFIIFMFNRETKEYLIFSILCLVFGLKSLTINVIAFFLLFPNVTFETFIRLDVILTEFTPFMLLTFSNSKAFNKKISRFSKAIYAILSVLIVATALAPLSHFRSIILTSIIVSIISSILLIIHGIIMIKSKVPHAIPMFVGNMILQAFILLDIYNIIFKTIPDYYSPLGFLSLLLIQVNSFINDNEKAYIREKDYIDTYYTSMEMLKTEETNYLSSRLKPHFLFNTLNIILGYAIDEPERSKKINTALVTYLKQLFEHDNLNELNELSNECDLLIAFGYIEMERFPDLAINYEIPKERPLLKVPSLLLQPLLENAVNYGVRKKNATGAGTITIRIDEKDNFVHFMIKDDGAGAPMEVFENALYVNDSNKYCTLYNIQMRLKNLYNEELHIESAPNKGTTITFKIPKK